VEESKKKRAGLKFLRTILLPVGGTWTFCGLAFIFTGRPIAGLVSLVVGLSTLALGTSEHRFPDKGEVFFTQWSIGLTVIGLFLLSLITGQASSPYLWLFTAVPAFAFYFLSRLRGTVCTLLALALAIIVYASENVVKIEPEALPGPLEVGAYQALTLFFVALISFVIKSLAESQVKALERAKEQVEEAAQSKGRFVDHVSHEMRHTLSAILGTFELVDPENLPAEQRSIFAEAQENAGLLNKMIDSTLLMTSIESGNFEPKLDSFYLEKLLQKIIEAFKERFRKNKLRVSFQTNGDFRLEGDRASLEYLLMVFIDNALKATEPGDSIEVKMEFVEGALKTSVKDSGCGIPETLEAKLLEPFSRDEGLDARKSRGFGLGLATATMLVDALDGKWGFETKVGEGSLFWTEIPCKDLGVTVGKAWNDNTANRAIRLLVVDDDLTCRKITGRLLEKLGHQVVTCEDGQQAVSRASDGQFDLIFMDCNMPVLDGFEATATLRQKGFTRPIIALTANTSEDDKKRCFDSGMNQVVGKPVTRKKLETILTEYFQGP
jgi:signal transduction histidine kinase/CheY-like chemotaxis protein